MRILKKIFSSDERKRFGFIKTHTKKKKLLSMKGKLKIIFKFSFRDMDLCNYNQ